MSEKLYDIIIIGGGPAGLTASIYSARNKLNNLLIESNKLGGNALKAHWVENYPGHPEGISGSKLMDKFINQAIKFGAEIKIETVVGINDFGKNKMVLTRKGFYNTKALILATGVSRKQLNIPGENEYKGRGVSYCAVCDGPFFQNKTVAVFGSGQDAIHDVELLSDLTNKVYAIPGVKGYSKEYEGLERIKENHKIEILGGYNISEINGDNLVSHIILEGKNKKKLRVDGVFIILEHVPTANLVSEVGIEVDKGGCIITSNIQETNIKGIFAAGDCSCKGMQIVTAAGMGANAALAAMKYIKTLKT
jgi:thioredoxin reductase (NADPH)